MSVNLGLLEVYLQYRAAELRAEAERERLANQVIRPGRPLRVRLAERLHAAAEWIEGSPRLANAQS